MLSYARAALRQARQGSWTEHFPGSTPARSATRTRSRRSSTSSSARRSSARRGSTSAAIEDAPPQSARTSPRRSTSSARRSSSCARPTDRSCAFHNICRHRGNKLVWNDYPQEETERHLPAVHLQVPRLALRPRGRAHLRAAGGRVLRPRQGGLRPGAGRVRRVGGVHLRELRPRQRHVAGRLPRASSAPGPRRLPVRQARPRCTSTAPRSRATGSCSSTPSSSSTTHRSCTRSRR